MVIINPSMNILKFAGNSFGYTHTVEALEKLRKPKSRVTIAKMSEVKLGENNFGKTLSPETKTLMSEAHQGKLLNIPKTEVHKERISQTRKGKTPSADTIAKISIAHIGNIHSAETKEKLSIINKGKSISDSTIAKMSIAKEGSIIIFMRLKVY